MPRMATISCAVSVSVESPSRMRQRPRKRAAVAVAESSIGSAQSGTCEPGGGAGRRVAAGHVDGAATHDSAMVDGHNPKGLRTREPARGASLASTHASWEPT
eukprot:4773947-Prymnesium_polylepis.1